MGNDNDTLSLLEYQHWEPNDGKPNLAVHPMLRGTYIVSRELKYTNIFGTLIIPEGFVLDLASVFWPIKLIPGFDPTNPKLRSAIIHDLNYWHQNLTRWESDVVFFVGLKADGNKHWFSVLLYFTVRIFGGRAWKNNARKKAESEEACTFNIHERT